MEDDSTESSDNHGSASLAGQLFLSVEERGILLIDVDQARQTPAGILWEWSAAESPEIKAEHRGWFRGYDECKPVLNGDALLICASWHGGVALIHRADKACLFYAHGIGAHSAELIGPDILALATSSEKGQLELFDLSASAGRLDAKSLWAMPLPSGHGAVYDYHRQTLYALGGEELVMLRVTRGGGRGLSTGGGLSPGGALSAEVAGRFKLPSPWGHDLSPYGPGKLAVTTSQHVYLFDLDKGAFEPLPALADATDVKCISRHPITQRVTYTQAEAGAALTNRLRFLDGQDDLPLPYDMIYKARWGI
jgi:hypothetical protein